MVIIIKNITKTLSLLSVSNFCFAVHASTKGVSWLHLYCVMVVYFELKINKYRNDRK